MSKGCPPVGTSASRSGFEPVEALEAELVNLKVQTRIDPEASSLGKKLSRRRSIRAFAPSRQALLGHGEEVAVFVGRPKAERGMRVITSRFRLEAIIRISSNRTRRSQTQMVQN